MEGTGQVRVRPPGGQDVGFLGQEEVGKLRLQFRGMRRGSSKFGYWVVDTKEVGSVGLFRRFSVLR